MSDSDVSTFDPFAGPAIVATAPTTEPQREIWTACALGDDASLAYNESITLSFEGALNVAALRASFDDVLARHDALRATISADGYTMMIGSAPNDALKFVDQTGLDADRQAAERAALAEREVRTPFDLVKGPLFRATLVKLDERRHYVVLTAHHIVFDGWSNAVLVSDWARLYAQRLGAPSSLAPAPSFAEYAREQAALPPEVAQADEQYWLQRFQGSLTSVDLPSDRLRPPLKTFSSRREDLHLDAELVSGLRRAGASFKASLFATLFGAFNVLVNRLSQQEDLVVGIPAAGQSQGEYGGLVGHCVNMLPIRSTVLRSEPFPELLGRVRSALLDAQEHQSFTFGKLLTKLPLPRDPSRLPLVSVIFNVDRAANDSVQFPELELRVSSNPRAYENFDLFLNAVETGGALELECQYNTDLFDQSTIVRWLATYETLLRSIAQEATLAVGQLNGLSSADQQQLAIWNERAAEFPRDLCVHDWVTSVARANPSQIACEFQGQSLSYAELHERSDAVARQLRSLGVKNGTLVGLCVERSPALIVGALAIWKAGGAYVPMDPGYPRERLAQMLEDSAAPVLLTETNLHRELGLTGATPAFIDQPADAPALSLDVDRATPESVAYVIYTSGSTGKPKGVLVPHRSVMNLLSSVAKEPGLNASDVALAVTTLSFDIAVSEIWLPLVVGAKIVMVSRETASDGSLLREVVEKRGVTFIDATPATYRLLLAAGWTGSPSLKLICTGEAMPLDLARQLLGCGGSLWNGYGPTETTVWSTFWQVPPTLSRVLIGHPVDNTKIYVLDEQRRSVPINVPGELYIAGSGVTHGYLNRPDLTAERFVDDPFEPGARMYRTGDLGRWLPTGELECMGRNDNQVKLRGFRIELGEIESALGQHPALGQVAVIKREDRPGDAKLVAYFVASGQAPSTAELRTHLKQTLPDYMVPSTFVTLAKMPLTPSGKIDRRALPVPEATPGVSDSEFVAPRTPMEKTMAELWSSMLGVGRVGVNDDFFALGGHSLLASQILARLRRDHGIQLSFRKFFEAPTVAKLAKAAEAAQAGDAPVLVPLVRRAPGVPVPLSMAQERITLMEQMHPSQQTTHILPAAWQMNGAVDLKLLQAALDVVVARHETLRTVMSVQGSQLLQQVRPSAKLEIESRDLRGVPAEQRRARMMEEIRERTKVQFDLYEGPLFRSVLYRLEDEEFVYFTLRHNVIWDGWSYDVFLAELSESYAALAEQRASKLPEPSISYGDFVLWQREVLKGAEIARQRDWWHAELADSPLELALPYDFPRPARMNYEGGTILQRFSQQQVDALTALGHQANTTLFMALFAAYATLLHRYTNQNDILVGLPVRGRQLPELENLIGSFTNTIVLRAHFDPQDTFLDFLKKTRDRALDAFSNEQLPLEMLQIRPPVVRALFSFQDARTRPLSLGDIRLKQIDVEPPAAANDLMVWMVERHDHLIAVVNYSTELFTTETIQRVVRSFATLVDDILRRPNERLSELMLVHEQDATLLREVPPPAEAPPTLPQLLSQRLPASGDSPAVLQGERATSARELDQMGRAVAGALLAAGVAPGAVVALAASPSAAALAGALGVWRVGGVLLGLDPQAPADVQQQLVNAAGATHLLRAESAPTLERVRAVALDAALTGAVSDGVTVGPDAPAWLRGCCTADGSWTFDRVSHADLSSAASALAARAELGGGRLAVGLQPLSHWFALEIALGLAGPATLSLPAQGARFDEALIDNLGEARADDAALVVAGALAELHAAGGKPPQLVLVAGSAPAELRSSLASETSKVLYLSQLATPAFLVLCEDGTHAFPATLTGDLLGHAGVVLDASGKVCPLGVAGQLHLQGFGAPQPLGLRARRLASGAFEIALAPSEILEFAGHRFDGGAVARCLAAHAAVAEAIVTVEEAGSAGARLVAYVVPAPGQSFTETELRRHARAALPGALVPQVFVEVAQLPRDQAGQIERKRLPSPFAAPSITHIPPRTASEKLLARLFSEVLSVPRVGVHDNFFDLGGQSLLCLRVIDMIERETKRRMSPRILLLNTVEQAASALDQLIGAAPETGVKPPPETGGVAGRVLKGLRGLLGG